jgi:DNA-binding CsgD family transcriptional regulator
MKDIGVNQIPNGQKMSYFSCLDELIKAISWPALVSDEEFKVVLRNLPEGMLYPWMGESPIGKTVFDLFSVEQAKSIHDACVAATELKQPTAHTISIGEPEQQREAIAKLIPSFNPASNSWSVILLLQYDSDGIGSVAQEAVPDEQPIGEELFRQHSRSEVEDARAALRFALRFLLKEGQKQIIRLKEETLSDLGNQFFPYIEGLKGTKLSRAQKEYVDLIESCARKFAEPFTRRISDSALGLSPTEIKIAGLIRAGKRNSQMAKIMQLSKSTILTHRHHIRAKLGLLNKKQNLQAFLATLGGKTDTEMKTKQ